MYTIIDKYHIAIIRLSALFNTYLYVEVSFHSALSTPSALKAVIISQRNKIAYLSNVNIEWVKVDNIGYCQYMSVVTVSFVRSENMFQ